MKKNLLFVIDSLDIAGAEKSLVTLLGLLDYNKFSVDLMLFAHGKKLEQHVPKEVTILDPLNYTTFSNLPLNTAVAEAIKKSEYSMLLSRFKYSSVLRVKKYDNKEKARLFWQSISKVIEANPKKYDIAISYAQGIPTFYVAGKVKAKQKYAWVNASYRLNEKEKQFQKYYYDQYDKVVAVSESAKEVFTETFPEYEDKMTVVYDINNPHIISKMAEIGIGYKDNFDGVRILTVGRLNKQKGYDIALDACKKLKESGLHFRWYAMGKGPFQQEVEQYIAENDLQEHFILLGVETNPYPFVKNADIYVQPSRFEGFGLAIAEARMLNVPVVTTRFDAVYNQMVDGKNGLVVDMNAAAVCDAVLKLISDKELRERIVCYLENEKKGNVEEVEKFYQLIG
ncbi:glycosyltransferase [Virgibacillus oceani]